MEDHNRLTPAVPLMAAMNVAPALIATDGGERTIWRSRGTEIHWGPGDCHGKGNSVLHTEELSETVKDGGSAATRKNHRVLPTDEQISLAVIHLMRIERRMTFVSTQTGVIRLEEAEKLLRAIFPNHPSVEPCLCASRLERELANHNKCRD